MTSPTTEPADEKVYTHTLPYYSYWICMEEGCNEPVYSKITSMNHLRQTGHDIVKNTGFQKLYSLSEEEPHNGE